MTKTIWFVLGIALAALLVVGGIFLYNNLSAPNQNNNPNPLTNVGNINSVAMANNQFALDLYKNWASNDGNMFFSPYSISSALAMTYEGAKGQTANEIQKVLHFPTDSSTLRSGFSQIDVQINNVNKPYALTTANALWAQKGYSFLSDYLNIVEQNYGGKATNLDFMKDAEGSRKIINSWVESKTNDKIVDLLSPGTINGDTRLVLTNAIYFKANWTYGFEKSATSDADFNTVSNIIKVPTMHQEQGFNYAETSDLQVLEMPYLGGDLSMLIILPKKLLSSVESSLDSYKLEQLRKSLKMQDVEVSLPTFKMETKYSMKDDLKKMGMPTAFSDSADFSGMTGKQDLEISEVIHQAFVNVTESGTEAAAATAVVMTLATAPAGHRPEPRIFNADHPFIFLIQQKDTGNILFMGRVENPLD